MKYSKSTITQLKKWYKSVLLKCALINAGLIIGASTIAPAIATESAFTGIVPYGEEITLTTATNVPVYSIWGSLINNASMTGMILKNGEENYYYNEDPYYGYLENNGTITLSHVFSNIYGEVINNGSITAAQLVNDYEFINHGNITLTTVDGIHSTVSNSGGFLNGATLEIKEDDDEYSQILGSTKGSIKGDVINNSLHYVIHAGSVRPAAIIRRFLFNGFVNNASIEGDVWNSDRFYNGLVYSATFYEDEDKEPTVRISGVKDAVIKSNVIWTDGQFLNGGKVVADTIYNGFMFDNGNTGRYFTEDGTNYRLEGAEITANTIYNSGFITNAGTINGNIVNLVESYPAAVALVGGTVNGSILSDEVAEEDYNKFDKFSWLFDEDDEDDDDNGGYIEPASLTTPMARVLEEDLYGSVKALDGTENTVTGAIKANILGVDSGSSLTVGGGITSGYLYVGRDTLIGPDDDEAPEIENKAARLDIGVSAVDTKLAYFDADSTLALTVNSESEHGKIVAGAFHVEDGATLEVTVNPGFTEIGKEYTLQLLEQTGNVDDYTPYQAMAIHLEEDDDEEIEDVVSEKFNNFNDDFRYEDNEMFKIVRSEEVEGAYLITQTKSAEEISEETGGGEKHTGAAKAWLDDGPLTTPASIAMASKLAHVAQYDKDNLNKVIDDLIPSDAPIAAALALENSNRIFSGVNNQLSGTAKGLASGDVLNDVSVWGGAYLGKTKLDNRKDTYGFDADSKGITIGLDKKVTPSVKLGLGFQYDETDVDGHHRKTDASISVL